MKRFCSLISKISNLLNKTKKVYSNLFLRDKIVIAFSMMTILLLSTLGFVSYRYSTSILKDESIAYTSRIIEQTVLNIDSYFEEINGKLQIVANNEILIDSLARYSIDYQEQVESYRNFKKLLIQYNLYNFYIEDVIIVKNGFGVYNIGLSKVRSDFDFKSAKWFTNNVRDVVKAIFISPHEHNYYYETPKSRYVISAIIPIRDSFKGANEELGVLLMEINMNKIKNVFDKLDLGNSGHVFMLDGDKNIVFHKNKELISTKMKGKFLETIINSPKGSLVDYLNDEKTLFIYQTSSVTGWKIVAGISMSRIEQHAGKIKLITIIMLLFGMLFIILISYIISSRITKTISRLMVQMDEVSKGNYHGEVAVESNDEVGMLSKRYNDMVKELNILIKENYLVKLKQKDAELNALQSKINPHFLYNTLQSIHSMAVLDRTQDIQKTIENLGELFDYVLYEHGNAVLIKDELRYLRSYLEIYKNRYNRRFDYSIDIDQRIENYIIPKLLLQPLVENALIHGLKDKPEGGYIKVCGEIEGDLVFFCISDNGRGMSDKELESTFKKIYAQNPWGKSIGLRNVYERIHLKYGDIGKFQIETKEREGTSIILKIPIQLRENND